MNIARILENLVCRLFKRPLTEEIDTSLLFVSVYDTTNDFFYYVPYDEIGGGGGAWGDITGTLADQLDLQAALDHLFPYDDVGNTTIELPLHASNLHTKFGTTGGGSLGLITTGLDVIFRAAGNSIFSYYNGYLKVLSGNTFESPSCYINSVKYDVGRANSVNVLTDTANIAIDPSVYSFHQVTLGGNRTLTNPTNYIIGTFLLKVIQDGAGGRTLAYGNAYKFPGGVPPVLSTGIGAVDILNFYCDGTNVYGVETLALA